MVVRKSVVPAVPVIGDVNYGDVESADWDDGVSWWKHRFDGGDVTDRGVSAAEVEQCVLSRVDFSRGVWRRVVWRDCQFDHVDLSNVAATDSGLRRSRLTGTRLTGFQWTNGVLRDVTVTDCRGDLSGFRFSKFEYVSFIDCKLVKADFTNTSLLGVTFSGCDLSGAVFHHASMRETRFDNCVLDGVSGIDAFAGATIAPADMMALTFHMAQALGITIDVPLYRHGKKKNNVGDSRDAVSLWWYLHQVSLLKCCFSVSPMQLC